MLLRGFVLLSILSFFPGCGKAGKTNTPKPPKNAPKEVSSTLAKSISETQKTCQTVYQNSDPDSIQSSKTYRINQAKNNYETCKTLFVKITSEDPSLVSFQGKINGSLYDFRALQKIVDDLPSRLEIAKTIYEEMLIKQKEADFAEWKPYLKGSRIKIFQERGKPTLTDAGDTSPKEGAIASTWIYFSEPREKNGKAVVDATIYTFDKKDRIVGGKPRNEIQEYIPPE